MYIFFIYVYMFVAEPVQKRICRFLLGGLIDVKGGHGKVCDPQRLQFDKGRGIGERLVNVHVTPVDWASINDLPVVALPVARAITKKPDYSFLDQVCPRIFSNRRMVAFPKIT